MLSISPELLGVSVLPVASAGRSLLHGLVSLLVHASSLLAGGSETSALSVLVLGSADPVDAWVSADGLVGRIDPIFPHQELYLVSHVLVVYCSAFLIVDSVPCLQYSDH